MQMPFAESGAWPSTHSWQRVETAVARSRVRVTIVAIVLIMG